MKENISKISMGQAGISLSTANGYILCTLENLLRNLGVSANAYGLLNQLLALQCAGLLHLKAPAEKRKHICFKSNG